MSGAVLVVQFGFTIAGGDLDIDVLEQPAVATVQGNFTFAGDTLYFDGSPSGNPNGHLKIEGNVNWDSGIYEANIRWDATRGARATLWSATGSFTIAAGVHLNPMLYFDSLTGKPHWTILEGEKGVSRDSAILPNDVTGYDIEKNSKGAKQWWEFYKT